MEWECRNERVDVRGLGRLHMPHNESRVPIVAALQVEHLVVGKPDGLAGARLFDQQLRVSRANVEDADLRRLLVVVEGVCRDLCGLADCT